MDVRPYEPLDRVACLGVFDSLTPGLLDSATRPFFEAWLDEAVGGYFVMEHEESIVGCGGYSFSPDRKIATLRWGMVRRSSQKMGLGRFLLMYRIREIGRAGTAGLVLAHTPRPSVVFYEKQGFRVNRTEKEERPPEFDCVEMIKKLTVCP
jgi:GNAT superfamily N-acetyltransferase